MNKLTIRSVRACAAAAAALCAVPAVLAQDAPAARPAAAGGLEEITVTARRREESLQDVPIAVSAFSGDDLLLRGAADIGELTQSVPSVTFEPTRATNSTLTAFIRGVGQQDPLAGFEQGVALYVDDVYFARPQGSLLDIFDVERIEVLRGPQGTLYGRNAVGGAIKYVTRRLGTEPDLRFKASYGSYNQVDLVATGSTPIGDLLRVGASVASLERDGYGDNLTTGADNYDKDVFAYRVSAEFTPVDQLSFRLAYDHTDDDSSPVAGYRPFPGARSGAPVLDDLRDTTAGAADRPSTAGINGNNEVESEGGSLTIDWNPDDAWTVRSITAYREDYTESVIDFDSLAVMDLDAAVIYDNDQFSQEFQVLYSGGRWNGVAGLYYLDASASNDFDVVLGQLAGGAGVTSFTGGSVDTKAWSAFADLTYAITDQWSISIGGRYTEDERSADVFRANYLGIGSPFFGNASATRLAVSSDFEAERTYYDFAPRFNVSYGVTRDVNLYASYSQGWKAGSFDPRGANFLTPEVEQGFDPEILDSYEIGMKANWLDGRARTNVAVFYSDYQDMQIPGSVGIDSDGDGVNDGFVGTVTNAAQSTIKGVEVEGDFLLTEELSVQLTMSLLDAEIDEWIVNGVDVSDQREVQNTPETMVSVGATYTTGLAEGTLTANLNATYRGDVVQFEVPNPYIDQESVTLANASVVWLSPTGRWSFGVHGKNLTDEDVRTAGYCFGFPATTGCPSALGLENNVSVFYGAPRTFTGTIGYRF
jgi:iron complex outermembrane receptor protein